MPKLSLKEIPKLSLKSHFRKFELYFLWLLWYSFKGILAKNFGCDSLVLTGFNQVEASVLLHISKHFPL